MIRLICKALLPVLSLVWAASASIPALARPTYTITDLGPPLGETNFLVRGMNNHGDVVGSNGGSAFLYSEGVMRDLGKLPIGGFAVAYGVNDARQVTGYTDRRERHRAEPGDARTFLYQDGMLQDLGTFGGGFSFGYAINNAGQVAGKVEDSGGSRGFVTGPNGTQILPTLGGNSAEARSINDAGQVVGKSTSETNPFSHAFVYADGEMRDLGTLGGRSSEAWAINEAGAVVGAANTPNDAASHAFVYRDGVMQDLGTLGGRFSLAYDINNANAIVGYSSPPGDDWESRAFLYSDGVMTNLSMLPEVQAAGWRFLTYAAAINDSGQITGVGLIGAEGRGFLLTPMGNTGEVPEPPVMLLLLAGVLALRQVQGRRRR